MYLTDLSCCFGLQKYCFFATYTNKNAFFLPKNIILCKKILSYQKKAVPLHAFSLNGYCELALLRVNNPQIRLKSRHNKTKKKNETYIPTFATQASQQTRFP